MRVKVVDGQYGMRKNTAGGAVIAFFDFISQGLIYRGWRLIEGANGRFVGPPSQPYEKDGERKFSDYVRIAEDGKHPDGRSFFDAVTAAASDEYDYRYGGEAQAAAQGRGPVESRRQPAGVAADLDGLPF
jgi:DNA-binding cell septation regulator SpoVG